MKRVSVRELHHNTSALLNEVLEGHSLLIERRGVPVAELRPAKPVSNVRNASFFRDDALHKGMKPFKTSVDKMIEEDRYRL